MTHSINGLRPTHIIIDDLIIKQGNTMIIKHVRHTDNANSITFSNGAYALFSYDTLVAFFDGNTEYIDVHQYSRTTTKHLSMYSRPYKSRDDHYPIRSVPHKELQQKLQTYMANHVIKNILGEVI